MHGQNLSIVIRIFSVIILVVNSNTAFSMPGASLGNFSRDIDESAFMKTRFQNRSNLLDQTKQIGKNDQELPQFLE